jgi:hypothetical protein
MFIYLDLQLNVYITVMYGTINIKFKVTVGSSVSSMLKLGLYVWQIWLFSLLGLLWFLLL